MTQLHGDEPGMENSQWPQHIDVNSRVLMPPFQPLGFGDVLMDQKSNSFFGLFFMAEFLLLTTS
jgi:hypothetical protein